MLTYIFYGLFVVVCILLILVVLIQSGKGGDVAAAFGGSGSHTAFGPRGAQKPLEKATFILGALFMLIALLMSLPGLSGSSSVVSDDATPAATPKPAAPATAPKPSPTAVPAVVASPTATPAPSPTATATPAKSQ